MYNHNQVEIQKIGTLNKYLSKVFMHMFLQLLIAAAFAYGWIHIPAMTKMFASIVSNPWGVWGIFGIQLLLAIGMGGLLGKVSPIVTFVLFTAYSIMLSLTFAVVGLMVDSTTIYQAFISASVLFIALAVIGYTTKKDLSQFGTIFFVAIIALIISSLLNAILFKSSAFDLFISFVGLAIFAGLTAYDVQKIKSYYYSSMNDSKMRSSLALYGAFMLYLDFVNIFFYLLRILGGNRD